MNKITKTEFKNILTSGTTTRFAIITESAITEDAMNELIERHIADIFCIPSRKAEIKGKYIVFDDESRLDINDNAFNIYTMYKYNSKIGTVLANECEWYDTFDKRTYYKTIYYMVH